MLIEPEIEAIRQSRLAQANLAKSARWFVGFLERNDHWFTKYNHNHLRITRVIKSLRLLASDKAADEFRDKVLALAGDNLNLVVKLYNLTSLLNSSFLFPSFHY